MLYNDDCLKVLKELNSDSIDLIITSPPYAKQRDYGGEDSDKYNDFIIPIFEQMKRVMKPNGNIVFNIKEHCNKGSRDLYVYKMIIEIVEKVELNFVDEFIWNKTNPFPTGSKKRLKDGFERIYHFTKTNNYKFFPNEVLVKSTSKWLESEKRRSNKSEHNVNNGSGMNMSKRIASDMVRPSNVLTMSTSNININHPAVFPDSLPEFFIKLMSEEGDFILDPFAGSGTTGVQALKLNRNIVMIEKNNEYFELMRSRLSTL